MNTIELLMLNPGERVPKTELNQLVMESKLRSSAAWLGDDFVINNTPQQGINWIGSEGKTIAVILKSYAGGYDEDETMDSGYIRYAFKARKGEINFDEKANRALTEQPNGGYPLLFFLEIESDFVFYGKFAVASIESTHVLLKPFNEQALPILLDSETSFTEGSRSLIQHMMRERNARLVAAAKRSLPWVCDICGIDTKAVYGVATIDGHHKVPLFQRDGEHTATVEDIALLCPTCHRIVHLYMSQGKTDYNAVKNELKAVLARNSA